MRTKSVKKNKINVITLGCSKNIYDSEVLNSSFVHLVKYSAKTPRLNAKPETVTPPFQTTTQQENITNFTDLHLSDPPQKKSSSAIPPQPHSIRIR